MQFFGVRLPPAGGEFVTHRFTERGCHRVPAKGRTVRSRREYAHHLVAAEHRRHRVKTGTQRFCTGDNIGQDALDLETERRPGVNGPNPSRAFSSSLNDMMVVVRPWKLPRITMMLA